MKDKVLIIDIDKLVPNIKSNKLTAIIKQIDTTNDKVIFLTHGSYSSIERKISETFSLNYKNKYIALFDGAMLQTFSGKLIYQYLMTISDFKHLTYFSINQRVKLIAKTPNTIYTTMHNLDKNILLEGLKNNSDIKVRNFHQLDRINNKLKIVQFELFGTSNKINYIISNLPEWIKKKFIIFRGSSNTLILLSKELESSPLISKIAETKLIDKSLIQTK